MEGTTSPTDEMFVFLVGRIEDNLQEFLVAGHAANIFGRAAACATETDGDLHDIVHRDYLLQHDFMPPVVSEIVLVDHRVAFSVKHVAQRNAAVVNHVVFFVFVQLNDAPVFTVPLELVKVAVRPAHYHLECAVKAAQLEGTGHLDHTPDRWLNADERDLQSIDGRRCLLRWHTNIVPDLGNCRCPFGGVAVAWDALRVHRAGAERIWSLCAPSAAKLESGGVVVRVIAVTAMHSAAAKIRESGIAD